MLDKFSNINISKHAEVHNTAVLQGEITIEDDVFIGPYCVLNGKIKLEKGVRLLNHVAISGNTTIGEGTTMYPFSAIGFIPQDTKYKGEETFLEIGKNNTIRESVTINSGTADGGFYTKIGDKNLFMIGSHVGHDCIIGNNCIIANNVGIAGHVILEDNVIIGGNSGIHQFVRIGRNVMIGGMSAVIKDIPPFALYVGDRDSKLRGLNLVGLKRYGFSREDVRSLKKAYDVIFKDNTPYENIKSLSKTNKNEKVQILIDFIASNKTKSICLWDSTAKQTDEQDV